MDGVIIAAIITAIAMIIVAFIVKKMWRVDSSSTKKNKKTLTSRTDVTFSVGTDINE